MAPRSRIAASTNQNIQVSSAVTGLTTPRAVTMPIDRCRAADAAQYS